MKQIEVLTTQLLNTKRKLKQNRRNFKVTEILKGLIFEADAERGEAIRGISLLVKIFVLLTITYCPFIDVFQCTEFHHIPIIS